MTTYKLVNDPLRGTPMQVFRSDGWTIPFDPDNRDYVEYLAWLAEGNTPTPAEEINQGETQ